MSYYSSGKSFLEHWKIIRLFLIAFDALAIAFSFGCALWLRFDCEMSAIPDYYIAAYLKFIPIYIVFAILIFFLQRLYKSIWRFASFTELLKMVQATVITILFHAIAITVLFERMPISYFVFGTLSQFFLTIGIRFSYRFVLLLRSRNHSTKTKNRIMLIGAGEAGQMILRDIMKSNNGENKVCCIIDDNPNKWGRYIDSVRVIGGRDTILTGVSKYQINKIYIAIPSAPAQEKREILNICKESGCELKNLPGMYQVVNGQVTLSDMKDVNVEDLLGRDPITVNLEEILCHLKDKVILITGGGGSIGSELARQIAAHSPKQLVLFDVYENNLYSIQLELKKKYPDLDLVALIGSVRDSRRLKQIFSTYHPHYVYHAAAHKHVPLMEDSPNESIKNNVVGTYKTAYMAALYNAEKFVLISTDKAVNPTNIMGASKRLCEMVVQSFDRIIRENKSSCIPLLYTHAGGNPDLYRIPEDCRTEFVAVRFGNVLGSNGSVIPLFKRQIAAGGPVTVTHPNIIRYFMTIPEAVSLVLQAGTYAEGGEIFVLDMGEPVKIDDLARNLIKLSGFRPDIDIKIQYVGLRPGEKLYEEKLMAEEGMKTTANRLIYIGKPISFDVYRFLEQYQELMNASYENCDTIRDLVADMVDTYHPVSN